jgi:hypothetical protein
MKNTAFCDFIASSRNSSTSLRRPMLAVPYREGRIGGRFVENTAAEGSLCAEYHLIRCILSLYFAP